MGQPETVSNEFIKSNDFNDIYSNFNGLELIWKNNTSQKHGSAKIQSQNDLIEDGQGDMVTEVEGLEGCDIGQFRVFDFFANQEFVGLFLNNYNIVGLFYVRDLTAYPLNITASSYLKLIDQTFGLTNWISLLVKWNLNIELLEAKNIEQSLAETFPDFNLDEFKNQYDNLKLK